MYNSSSSSSGSAFSKRRKKRRPTRKAVCRFCKDEIKAVDYKEVGTLLRMTTPQGKILGRKRLGTCAKHQRMVKTAIKRARFMALLPFVKLYI